MPTNKVLYSNERYDLIVTDDALDEDNVRRVKGYAVVNREHGVYEATGLILGEMRWRMDQSRCKTLATIGSW